MSVEVDFYGYDNVFQADEYQEWTWGPLGASGGCYWSCAVVPELANVSKLEVASFWWSSDNTGDFNLTAHFLIRYDSGALNPDAQLHGGLFGVKAIRAV